MAKLNTRTAKILYKFKKDGKLSKALRSDGQVLTKSIYQNKWTLHYIFKQTPSGGLSRRNYKFSKEFMANEEKLNNWLSKMQSVGYFIVNQG